MKKWICDILCLDNLTRALVIVCHNRFIFFVVVIISKNTYVVLKKNGTDTNKIV